jgi:hypothetical protein
MFAPAAQPNDVLSLDTCALPAFQLAVEELFLGCSHIFRRKLEAADVRV